ncbi:hypothetical protein BC831DRAFT_450288 [Entophlyctis helioformis]|nr:hypothetical protein BC831DRAFT_450288 [Entophlyctis helioformis]
MGHITVLVQHAWAMQPTATASKGAGGANRATAAPAQPRRTGIGDDHPGQPPTAAIATTTTSTNANAAAAASAAANGGTGAATSASKQLKTLLAAKIRVTVPSSVAQLVRLYNSSTTASQRRACEVAARDIIARLEFLTLASTIPDPFRKDMIRAKIFPAMPSSWATSSGASSGNHHGASSAFAATVASGPSAGGYHGLARRKPLKPIGRHPTTNCDLSSASPTVAVLGDGSGVASSSASGSSANAAAAANQAKTRRFASEARLSVLMLARCRTRHIRDRSMDLLLEALDTNILSTDPEEIQSLQHLWSELVHVFRSVIDDRRRRRAVAGGLAAAAGPVSIPLPLGDVATAAATAGRALHHPGRSQAPTDVDDGSDLEAGHHGRHGQQHPHRHHQHHEHHHHHGLAATNDQDVAKMVEKALDTKVLVDAHLERVLSCLFLTMQRLEYARDVKHFEFLPVMDESFQLLMEDFALVRAEDPFIQQLISSIDESVHFMSMSSHDEKEEVMAFPVGVSLLSQIVRMMPPDDLMSMYEPFHGIMADLNEKSQWHLGRKFLRILASAAMINQEACLMFVKLVRGLDSFNWQWQFLGILCLGAIACASQSSSIRRLALEDGLLYFIDLGNDDVQSNVQPADPATKATPPRPPVAPTAATAMTILEDYEGVHPGAPPPTAAHAGDDDDVKPAPPTESHAWKMRAAAIVSLTEVYQQYRSQPHGLLAREVMSNQRTTHESHPIVCDLLNNPSAIAPQDKNLRRTSFLFKYCCVSLAELYADSQSDYMYLRKYVRTAEKNDTRRRVQQLKQAGSNARINNQQPVAWDRTWDYHQHHPSQTHHNNTRDGRASVPPTAEGGFDGMSMAPTATMHGHLGDGAAAASAAAAAAVKQHRSQSAEPLGGIHYAHFQLDEPAKLSTRHHLHHAVHGSSAHPNASSQDHSLASNPAVNSLGRGGMQLQQAPGSEPRIDRSSIASIGPLSVAPYHSNYKRVQIADPQDISDAFETYSPDAASAPSQSMHPAFKALLKDPTQPGGPYAKKHNMGLAALPPLAPSTLPAYSTVPQANVLTSEREIAKPGHGTANRRKLVNADRDALIENAYGLSTAVSASQSSVVSAATAAPHAAAGSDGATGSTRLAKGKHDGDRPAATVHAAKTVQHSPPAPAPTPAPQQPVHMPGVPKSD